VLNAQERSKASTLTLTQHPPSLKTFGLVPLSRNKRKCLLNQPKNLTHIISYRRLLFSPTNQTKSMSNVCARQGAKEIVRQIKLACLTACVCAGKGSQRPGRQVPSQKHSKNGGSLPQAVEVTNHLISFVELQFFILIIWVIQISSGSTARLNISLYL
jgi:hypothetical protein